jgi:hypothetical protein
MIAATKRSEEKEERGSRADRFDTGTYLFRKAGVLAKLTFFQEPAARVAQ